MNILRFAFITSVFFCNPTMPLGFLFKKSSADFSKAIENNDIDTCKKYLSQSDAKVNFRFDFDTTALWLACCLGHKEICALLIEKGADIEAHDSLKRTPLHISIENDGDPICRLLIEKGANIEATDEGGQTPLHIASRHGNATICDLLIKKQAKINVKNKDGGTPLDFASDAGKNEVCKLLIKNGAAEDKQNKSTPLHWAASKGNEVICSYLIEQNTNIDHQDSEGKTALHIAYEKGNRKVRKLLFKKHLEELKRRDAKGESYLHYAILAENLPLFKLLVEDGAKVNSQNEQGATPLMLLCKKGAEDCVKCLLSQDTLNKEIKDDVLEGTALYWAYFYDQKHIHLACELGFNNLIEKFLVKKVAKHVDIDAKTKAGKTPLHCAVEKNNTKAVKLLLKYDALPNEADDFGKTPLMYAAELKQVEVCKLLKEKISVSDFNRVKAFLMSLVRGHRELEDLFDMYYSELPIAALYDSVPANTNYGPQATMSTQSLRGIEASRIQNSQTESSYQENKLNDQVSEVGTSET